MAYSQMNPGLYVARRRLPGKAYEHVGVLDVGNRLRQPGVGPWQPVVVHLGPAGPVYEEFVGEWQIERQVADERGAVERFYYALSNRQYDPILNNCEHFAFFVADGIRRSPQVRGFAVGLGVIALVGLMIVGSHN